MLAQKTQVFAALWMKSILCMTTGAIAAGPELRPIIKRWTVSDFDPVISVGLEGYRDFENGRQRFSDASCVKCHRFAGEGPVDAMAPDLAKAAELHSPGELLEAIISPGLFIAAGDTVHVFKLSDGKLIKGRVVEESETDYLISPDPHAPRQFVKVMKSTIVTMRRTSTSLMPSGLLDSFEEEDVLDLLAYLLSGGNRNDPAFSR